MRRSSYVTMIVAAALILIGIIVCAIGQSVAKDENYMLYPTEEDGVSVYRHDFTGDGVNKITVSAKNAKITVKRGGGESFIEIRNFNANYYKLTTENKVIAFSEVSDIASMFKFWEGGFSFKGMRYIFHGGTENNAAKEITVNIARAEDVKLIQLTSAGGTVTLDSFDTKGDVSVISSSDALISANGINVGGTLSVSSSSGKLTSDVLKAGTVLFSGAKLDTELSDVTAELIRFEMKSGKVQTHGLKANEMSAALEAANLTIDRFNVLQSDIHSGAGQVTVTTSDPISDYSVDVTSTSASIFIDGVHYSESCLLPSATAQHKIVIVTDSGSVSVADGIEESTDTEENPY